MRAAGKTLLLNVGFYGFLLVLTVTAIGFASVPVYTWRRIVCRDSSARAVRWFIWMYARCWAAGLRVFQPVQVTGMEQILPGPCIFVANHQSFFDPYCFGFLPEHNLVFTVRSWPFRIPFYGVFMYMAGYLNTETLGGEQFLQRGVETLHSGAHVAVFAEGTRSRDGALKRFRAGAFELAARSGAPIVPLCINGTGAMLRPGSCLLRSAPIQITLLPPVWPSADVDDIAAVGELRRTVKESIEHCLATHGSP